MPAKGKVSSRLLGKLVWGLAAAITEFLTTLPSEVGTQRMTNRWFGCRLTGIAWSQVRF